MAPDADEPLTDVRRRRAERSQGGTLGQAGRRARTPLLVLAGVLVVALAVWGASQLEGIQRPTEEKVERRHWHAGFKIFLDGRELDLHHCEFDLNGCEGKAGTNYLAGHLHHNEALRHMVHIEHPVDVGNLTLKRFIDHLGFELTNTSLRLDDRVYDRESYADNATHALQLWVSACVVEPPRWTQVEDITGYVPQQHDRFLLTYTDQGREILDAQTAGIPTSTQMFEAGGGQCPRVVGTVTSSAAP